MTNIQKFSLLVITIIGILAAGVHFKKHPANTGAETASTNVVASGGTKVKFEYLANPQLDK